MNELKEFSTRVKAIRQQQREMAVKARSLNMFVLMDAMKVKSGQSYKLRALLFSLWNGKPADLSDVLALDWTLRKALLEVCGAFGFEEQGEDAQSFFYDQMSQMLQSYGLFTWFIAEGEEKS